MEQAFIPSHNTSPQDSTPSILDRLPAAAIEREIKFGTTRELLKSNNIRLQDLPCIKIEQRYFPEHAYPTAVSLYESKMSVEVPREILDLLSQARIRSSEENGVTTYELTMKSPRNSLGTGERIELPAAPLSAEEFKMLSHIATDGYLKKDRYLLTPISSPDGVMIEIDVLRAAGPNGHKTTFGSRGWEVVTIDIEVADRETLARLMAAPGKFHPVLHHAVNLEEYPKLRQRIGATSLANGERSLFSDITKSLKRKIESH
jgi:hypothetical protein